MLGSEVIFCVSFPAKVREILEHSLESTYKFVKGVEEERRMNKEVNNMYRQSTFTN